MNRLVSLHIEGFKSIQDQKLEFEELNVFIGSNGAGKSNLVGTLSLLRRISNQQLQTHTGESGGANAMLHFGRKTTPLIRLRAEFHKKQHENIYKIELKPTALGVHSFRIDTLPVNA